MMRAPTVLHLNLSEKSFESRIHEDLTPLIGGLGWALALFDKELVASTDQVSEHEKIVVDGLSRMGRAGRASPRAGLALGGEPLVFAIGPLSGVIPGCSKTVAVFRSPQNGALTTSLGGGHIARFLRFSGYQAVVITGSARKPTMVSINGEQVVFKDGSHLANKELPRVFELLFAEEDIPVQRSVVAPGPAAWAGVRYAPLYVDEFFAFARGGLGAAFALKNLAGLSICGSGSDELVAQEPYRETFNPILKRIKGFGELRLSGTLKNLKAERKISGVPFENLAEPNFEDPHQLAKSFSEQASRLACSGCPVGCAHLVRHEGSYIPYDYESVVALGPLLGITNKEGIVQLLAHAYRAGLDPVSLGVILAYLTEREKLSFGDANTYTTLIDALLAGREEWAVALRRGLAEGIKTLGGEEYALVLAGMEFLPYFNGYASLLSQALSLSTTTEDNRGFLLDIDLLGGEMDSWTVAMRLVAEEKRRTLVELLVGCGYLSSVFEETAAAFTALEAVGAGVSHEELEGTVGEVFRQKLMLQKKLGFDPRRFGFPARFFSIPSPQGILKEGKLREMIEGYVKMTDYEKF